MLCHDVYSRLKGKGFTTTKRGEIEVRGRGKMTTFFLEKNERASLDDLVGQRPSGNHNSVEVTFINDGRVQRPPRSSSTAGSRSPLLPANRVRPESQGCKCRKATLAGFSLLLGILPSLRLLLLLLLPPPRVFILLFLTPPPHTPPPPPPPPPFPVAYPELV